MKKSFLMFAGLVVFAFGCNKTAVNEITNEDNASVVHRCASTEVLAAQLLADPTLADRMNAIESVTEAFIKNPPSSFLSGGNVVIPVWVNVLYNTAAQNISDVQINSQIAVLNADFSALNADYASTPAYFQAVRSGDTKIRFQLAGITRQATTKASWRTDDTMKKSKRGGIDPTSPSNTLNLWSCNMSGGILGYAQFPGGALATDGVVIEDNAFGNTGTAAAPYGLGRTATHEVGHWLNLRHIWGDATCGNDFVNDTPVHQTSNFGCPAFPTYGSCSSTIPMQTMNYMDYTYDACMYMFSAGQNTRMQATFVAGGGRTGFAL